MIQLPHHLGNQNVRDEELPLGRMEPNHKQSEETKQSRWGFRGMTVRAWLELLVVPLALVVIGFLFSVQQDARQQRIENQRAEAERELAVQRAQDEALQAYLDQMSGLLLERDLRVSEKGSEVRTLARARTLTVLSRLDPNGKTALMEFLVEADLVQRADGRDPIIGLSGADLSGANLSYANLSYTNLSEANLSRAHLRGANLREAVLSETHLREAVLRDADLSGANLRGAFLSEANLRGAFVRDADLSDADLSDADLSEASLSYANLSYADLSGAFVRDANLFAANLSSAEGITNEQLDAQAESLEGATMPNGQKYEDWLKSKSGGKDGENSRPS